MEDQLKQIGERLRGLRDVLDIPIEEMAATIDIGVDKYEKIERGEVDITISNLMKIAHHCGVSPDALMFGEEPHMRAYYVTRKGQAQSVERIDNYKYESLTSGFRNPKANAFVVTVKPKPDAKKIYKNTHTGEEFNYVLSGTLEVHIGNKIITLQAGDSIYFESTTQHGLMALGDQPAKFVAVTIE